MASDFSIVVAPAFERQAQCLRPINEIAQARLSEFFAVRVRRLHIPSYYFHARQQPIPQESSSSPGIRGLVAFAYNLVRKICCRCSLPSTLPGLHHITRPEALVLDQFLPPVMRGCNWRQLKRR